MLVSSTEVYIFSLSSATISPFHDYINSYETGQSVGGRKRVNPEKKHMANLQAESEMTDCFKSSRPCDISCLVYKLL